MRLSIIIPVLNESECIGECLAGLQELRGQGHEVIVVDGGSSDETVKFALASCDKLLTSSKGRARQMNTGAAAATGDIYVFLHADTRFDSDPARALAGIGKRDAWGCFSVRLSGAHYLLRLFEFFINLRSGLTGIVSGDQTLYICRDLFIRAGGYPDIPLMEDIAISKVLKRYSPPVRIPERVVTSSRRFRRYGMVRTMLKMWLRRLRFALGVNPATLVKDYD